MVSARVATALLGILLSLAISAIVWYVFGNPFLFLAVPFVPFLFRRGTPDSAARPPLRVCEHCGFAPRDPDYEYCPRDGHRLRES